MFSVVRFLQNATRKRMIFMAFFKMISFKNILKDIYNHPETHKKSFETICTNIRSYVQRLVLL